MVEVLATFGDNHLGGNDFDKRIADWIAAEFRKQYNMNPASDRTTYRRLLEAGERLKVRLSNAPQVSKRWQPLRLFRLAFPIPLGNAIAIADICIDSSPPPLLIFFFAY